MDQIDRKLLLVTDRGEYFGIVSAGDIQRSIIANHQLETPIEKVMGNREISFASPSDGFESIKRTMLRNQTEFMPVLHNNELVDVYFWDEVFGKVKIQQAPLNLPVVIMAGGKGTRLEPLSKTLPKPLFSIGIRTILEEIIRRFIAAGCDRFWLSLNYKADFIQSYMEMLEDKKYQVHFLVESQPLGSAGSLSLLKETLQETFFVSNCDILIETDYGEMLEYHRELENEITLVGAVKEFRLPYGTLETGSGGQLQKLVEKPNLSYLINGGLYLVEPHLLREIPEDTEFPMTQLIENVLQRQGRVGVFPVSEKSWLDIGEWHEYERTINLLSF
ncbi:MAG: NTP transferase domain-containing protein [Gammaproteobacteria bacterium]|nr:NTP transferase domain-containing protein [Gammaproteobacteria bacterium]